MFRIYRVNRFRFNIELMINLFLLNLQIQEMQKVQKQIEHKTNDSGIDVKIQRIKWYLYI